MAAKSFGILDDSDLEEDEHYNSGNDDDSSDFEDPDKVEVPGGGIDLETAVNYANKKKSSKVAANSLVTNGSSISKTYINNNNNNNNSLLLANQRNNNRLHNVSNSNNSNNMPKKTAMLSAPNVTMGLSLPPVSTANNRIPATATATAAAAQPSPLPSAASAMVNETVLHKLNALISDNPNLLASGIPNHIFSQLIMTSPAKSHTTATALPLAEEEDADYEEMGVAETYAEYWPAKLKLGKKHPDPVVETASLSSVAPCDVYYRIAIPLETINNGSLSALQLESITYASQAHEHFLPDGSRAGFLIGDGAGVGKGRTIAGIIYENYLHKRKKTLWISVSNDLRYDAERDLEDIGASKIRVYALNKLKYAKINSDVNGNCKRGVIFSTYSALIGETSNKDCKFKSRLKQLLHWCGDNFDGLIVFDECHKAKNLCPVGAGKSTKTGQTVLELQKKLPNARVIYASATGASEPKNMAYMVRLGLWGPGTAFANCTDFITAVEKRGVGAMEIVAMDMKLRGMYIARQLSFHGVTFTIEEVPLTKEFRRIYDEAVQLWVDAMHKFTEAAELVDAASRMKKTMWAQFWSSHQRFFKYLCIASKVSQAVRVAKAALQSGKCVVIGLQSTGEARTLEQLERDDGELTDFVSTAKGVFESLVIKHFPAPNRSRIYHVLGHTLRDIMSKSPLKEMDKSTLPKKRKTTQSSRKSAAAKKSRKANCDDSDCSTTSTASSSSSSSSSASSSPGSDNATTGTDSDSDIATDSQTAAKGGRKNRKKKRSANSAAANNNSTSDASDSEPDLSDNSFNANSSGSCSSDYNPFGNGSDSEQDEPWVAACLNREKKLKQKKEAKQKQRDARKQEMQAKKQQLKREKREKKLAAKQREQQRLRDEQDDNGFRTDAIADKKKAVLTTPDKIQQDLKRKQEMKDKTRQVGINGVYIPYGPPPKDAVERACSLKEELLAKIEKIGQFLPPNTLDQLIDELGGPRHVAEMTGRKGRVVQHLDGSIQYQSRTESDVPLETLNIKEKQRFMNGEKNVAIISEAASSGISLQSDKRVKNQRRRVHITLELPWSADRAVQQFGRTHRSNQRNAPEYIFLISDLAGERRFASTVAKRLESLGALTHGDRRATETRDLSQFNIDNKYGRSALEIVMKTIMGYEDGLVPPPSDYAGHFFKDVAGALVGVGIIVNSESTPGLLSLEKDYNNISKFLNRILGMPVELQNRLFKYFNDTLVAVIHKARRGGRFDLGILDLGAAGENVTHVKLLRFQRKHATGISPIELHTVRVERGMIWQEAIDKYSELTERDEGFYLSQQMRNNKRTAVLAVQLEQSAQQPSFGKSNKQSSSKKLDKKNIMFQIFRPNTGLQVRHESLAELEKKYKKVDSNEAEPHWLQQYDASANSCSHAYWSGHCRNVAEGHDCEVGLRQRIVYVLGGSVLSVWSRIEQLLAMRSAHNKMQVIRMKTTTGVKIVGTLVPKYCYQLLIDNLRQDAASVEEENFMT